MESWIAGVGWKRVIAGGSNTNVWVEKNWKVEKEANAKELEPKNELSTVIRNFHGHLQVN